MDAEIRTLYQRCRERYPTVQLEFEEFQIRIRQVMQDSAPPARIHYEDLYLATACARGDRIAWQHFADDFVPSVHRFAAQACRSAADGEDLAQDLVRNLLEKRQKIAAYSGRGSLLAWLRVTVARAAIDRFRRVRADGEVSLEELGDEARLPGARNAGAPAAPGENLDARWGTVLSQLLEEEIRRLSPSDRLLIALYYVQGLSLKSIAGHFRMHESTASRRLDGLRANLKRRVLREMHRRHGLRPREIEALWELAARSDALRVERALQ
jgi:RNA polymerase sigma-70 factor (ECF subfamily)